MQIKDKIKDVRKFQLIFVYYRKILIIYMQVLQECQPYMYASQMVRVMHKFAIVLRKKMYINNGLKMCKQHRK